MGRQVQYDDVTELAALAASDEALRNCSPVIPAKAGIHLGCRGMSIPELHHCRIGCKSGRQNWIPAFAGMTGEQLQLCCDNLNERKNCEQKRAGALRSLAVVGENSLKPTDQAVVVWIELGEKCQRAAGQPFLRSQDFGSRRRLDLAQFGALRRLPKSWVSNRASYYHTLKLLSNHV
jgi:hypothetical protein